MNRKSTLSGNLAWGLKYGLGLAALFSILVSVLALIRGSDWNPTHQVSTRSLILGYAVAGVLGGLVVGLLRPLTTHRLGATLVGMLAGVFAYSAVALAMDGMAGFRPMPAIVAGLLVGGIVGFLFAKGD